MRAVARKALERLQDELDALGVRSINPAPGYGLGTLDLVKPRGRCVRVTSEGQVSLYDTHEGTPNQRVLTVVAEVLFAKRDWPKVAAQAIADHQSGRPRTPTLVLATSPRLTLISTAGLIPLAWERLPTKGRLFCDPNSRTDPVVWETGEPAIISQKSPGPAGLVIRDRKKDLPLLRALLYTYEGPAPSPKHKAGFHDRDTTNFRKGNLYWYLRLTPVAVLGPGSERQAAKTWRDVVEVIFLTAERHGLTIPAKWFVPPPNPRPDDVKRIAGRDVWLNIGQVDVLPFVASLPWCSLEYADGGPPPEEWVPAQDLNGPVPGLLLRKSDGAPRKTDGTKLRRSIHRHVSLHLTGDTTVNLSEAILCTFVGLPPPGGKHRHIGYRDGNLKNTNPANIYWREGLALTKEIALQCIDRWARGESTYKIGPATGVSDRSAQFAIEGLDKNHHLLSGWQTEPEMEAARRDALLRRRAAGVPDDPSARRIATRLT